MKTEIGVYLAIQLLKLSKSMGLGNPVILAWGFIAEATNRLGWKERYIKR